jgi:hypothetical protein
VNFISKIQADAASNASQSWLPNIEEAGKFLELLDPDQDSFLFSSFDDDAERDRRRRTKLENGVPPQERLSSLIGLQGWIAERQALGANICVSTQAMRGAKRQLKELAYIRTIFGEFGGGDKFRIATMISLALSIAMLLILELLASLSGDAAMLLAKAANTLPSPIEAAIEPQAAGTQIAKPIKVVPNRAYYLARLEHGHPQLAAQVYRGELSVHKAAIQAGLRKAPTRRSGEAA